MPSRPLAALALIITLLPYTLWADARSEYLAAAELQKAKNWAEAAQGYAKVTALSPEYAPAWKQLATCRYYMNDLEGAEATGVRYLKLQPGDASFAAWHGQLRAKLKLPPLELTPRPTAAPTPLPVATLEVMAAIPAPGADAQVVSPNEVTFASEQGSQTEIVVEESAVHYAKAAAAWQGPRWALRTLGSFSLGLGKFAYGEEVNSSTTASNKNYGGQPGLGLGGVAELLYKRSEGFELSLGVYPLQWQETRKSDMSAAVTRSNESSAKALFMPIMVGLGWRGSLSNGFSAILSLGAGAVPSAQVELQSQTVQTNATGLQTSTLRGNYSYGAAPAWRVGLGLEAPLSKKVAFYLGGQVLGANFADAGGSGSYEVVDESGTVLLSNSNAKLPNTALSLMSASALAGLAFSF